MTHPTVKLGEVAKFIRGITFKPDDVVPPDAQDAVVCMRTKNVQTLLDCDDVLAVPAQFVRRKDQYLCEGDILVSSANSWNLVGKCCWVPALPRSAAFGGFISVLRGDSTRVNKRYLYWWFASERIQALLRSFGQKTTNISNLNIDRCLQLELPLPEIAEQRRLAAILDKADAVRTKRREALAQLDRLAQSIFLEMFGDPITNPNKWPKLALANISLRIQIGPFGSQLHEGDYIEGGIPLVNPTHIRQGRIEPNLNLTVPEDKYRALEQYHLAEGDLILGRRGEMGRCAVVSAKEHGWLCGTGSLFVRPNTTASLPAFLSAVISSQSMRKHLENLAQGVTMANLNKNIVGALLIALPPLELQRTYSARIGDVGKLAGLQRMTQSVEQQLFNSLQYRAFRGEL